MRLEACLESSRAELWASMIEEERLGVKLRAAEAEIFRQSEKVPRRTGQREEAGSFHETLDLEGGGLLRLVATMVSRVGSDDRYGRHP